MSRLTDDANPLSTVNNNLPMFFVMKMSLSHIGYMKPWLRGGCLEYVDSTGAINFFLQLIRFNANHNSHITNDCGLT
jgi:hypothetical protein